MKQRQSREAKQHDLTVDINRISCGYPCTLCVDAAALEAVNAPEFWANHQQPQATR
jgi:hypothetical protein